MNQFTSVVSILFALTLLTTPVLAQHEAHHSSQAGSNQSRAVARMPVPHNPVYVMTGPSDAVATIDFDRRKLVGSIPAGRNPHSGVLTPDGNHIYAASMSTQQMTVIDTKRREVVAEIDLGAISHHATIRPDGRYVYAAAGQVKVIDTEINEVIASIETRESPFYPVLSPDGRRLYVLSSGTTISVIDTDTHRLIETIEVGSRAMMGHLAVAPDGKTLYATSDAEGKLSIIDVSSGRRRNTVPVGQQPHGVVTDAVGGRVYVSTRTGRLFVVDTQTEKIIDTRSLDGEPEHLSRTADGAFLLVGLKNRHPNGKAAPGGSAKMTDAIAILDARSLKTVEEIPVWTQVHEILMAKPTE